MTAPFAAFTRRLLESGEALLPLGFETRTGRDETARVLADAFALHALWVAGPRIAFDEKAALAAAELVAQAAFVSAVRSEPLDEVERLAAALVPRTPPSASEHLSVDLTLRFAVGLERRARAAEPGSRLHALLADTLRRWPLTGATSAIGEPPLAPLPDHPGLVLAYEERLIGNPKPLWNLKESLA